MLQFNAVQCQSNAFLNLNRYFKTITNETGSNIGETKPNATDMGLSTTTKVLKYL